MVFSNLLRSTLRNQLVSQAKHVSTTVSGSTQRQLFQAPVLSRFYSTAGSLEKENSTTDSADTRGFKRHDMLAPFTSGWQSTDVHPLVIEKSEGSYIYDINGKKYLDSLAGLWCTTLGGNKPRLINADVVQLNKLPVYRSFWNRITKPSLDLATELLEMFTAAKMEKSLVYK